MMIDELLIASLGVSDGEADALFGAEIQNAVEIHDIQGDTFRLCRDAGIARCAINFVDLI